MIYRRVLGVPAVGPLLAAMVLARLPVGATGLAMVLFLRDERGSFGVAGLVAGALALGTAAGGPLLARLVDRRGRRSMGAMAVVQAAGLVGVVALAPTGAPDVLLAVLALISGAAVPPVAPVLRTLYPRLLTGREPLLPATYALDSVVTELIFVSGPLVVGGFIAFASARAALLAMAGIAVVGTAVFLLVAAAQAAERPATARTAADGAGRGGALASPGIRVLVATIFPFGLSFGVLDVGIPAFAVSEGEATHAAILLTVWSLASAAGGFWYGVRERRVSAARWQLGLAIASAALVAPVALAPSVLVMGLLLVVAGLPVGPLITIRNELTGVVAPTGARTEAFTWVSTAMVAGIGLGAVLGGALVDASGWRAAAVASTVLAGMGALASRVGQRTLVAAEHAGRAAA